MFTAFPMSFMARCPERNSCTKRCRRVQVAIRKTGSPECKPLSAWQLRRLQLVSIDIFLRFTAMFEKLLWPNTHIIWGSVVFLRFFSPFVSLSSFWTDFASTHFASDSCGRFSNLLQMSCFLCNFCAFLAFVSLIPSVDCCRLCCFADILAFSSASIEF